MKRRLGITIAIVLVALVGLAILMTGLPSRDYNLRQAADSGDLMQMRILILLGANLDAKDKGELGLTPLHKAALSGQTKAAELLINKGAKVDAASNNGKTALILAATMGNKEVVELLLSKGADVDAQDAGGYTALGYASDRGNDDIADLLSEHEATSGF